MKITVIGITHIGRVTSAFGFYLDSTTKVYIHRLRFPGNNDHKLRKYLLLRIITMLRLLLPLEDDCLTVDKNYLRGLMQFTELVYNLVYSWNDCGSGELWGSFG